MTDKPSEIIYSFEDFHLDPSRKLLLRLPDGEQVPLTNKAINVLSLLVENRGKLVTKDVLMASVWQDSVVEEANLTQTISVLRKILGENPNQHRFIVTEPGKGYRFVARVSKLNGDREARQPEDPEFLELPLDTMVGRGSRASSLFAFTGILAVFLIAAGLYFWNGSQTQSSVPTSAREVRAIAVLPFRSIEPDGEDQLLGIGMTEAVITKLSLIKSLVVRQMNSVTRDAETTPDAAKVGREIDVDAVLEGNIQKADGRIRVSVRLVRAGDGALLWAENFDERDADIFAVQDSIAEEVATSLSLGLNADEHAKLKHRYTENVEAYQLYNKARFFWNNRTGFDLRKSLSFYEQAIVKDENYALAYASLAESYVLLQLFSQNQDTRYYLKAKEAAEKALSLDPNIAEAHAALALYKQHYEWDWEGAEIAFKRAISINPNYATAHQWYGEFLALMGRIDESISEVERAVELDPLSLSTNTARAVPYLASERYAEAIDKLQPALELDETFSLALLHKGRSFAGLGDYKQAIAEYQKSMQNPGGGGPFFITGMINSLAKDGQRKKAEEYLNALLEIAERHSVSNYVLARGLAPLGYKERAYEELEKAFLQRDGLMPGLKTDRNFDEMRGEARFQEILKKMRL